MHRILLIFSYNLHSTDDDGDRACDDCDHVRRMTVTCDRDHDRDRDDRDRDDHDRDRDRDRDDHDRS